MTITKAIIPVAGWGTRRLPITKTIEKCMLPVGNRPIVDYVVQDCLKAGITDIIFVVSEQSDQIRHYYRSNIDLNDYLKRNDKADLLDKVSPIKANLHFVVQPSYGKYGSAVPVSLAAQYLEPSESVIVVSGDDFIYNTDGSSEISRLIADTPDGANGMLGVVVDQNDTLIPRYGFMETNERSDLVRIVEHPDPEPEIFIKNVSKYLFNYGMVQAICANVAQDRESGEYGMFDAFEGEIAKGEVVHVVPTAGRYLDGGNVKSWLVANEVVIGTEYDG